MLLLYPDLLQLAQQIYDFQLFGCRVGSVLDDLCRNTCHDYTCRYIVYYDCACCYDCTLADAAAFQHDRISTDDNVIFHDNRLRARPVR